MRNLACILLLALVGVAPARLDSYVVVQRYVAELRAVKTPKNVIFVYTLSQAGPTDLEQRHRVYRRGIAVRDEMLHTTSSKLKTTVITRRADRYAIRRVAPRPNVYGFLFVKTEMLDGARVYLYDTVPYVPAVSNGFTVTRIAIDAVRFLPRMIAFRTTNGIMTGQGAVHYAPAGRYWMPVSAFVTAKLAGKPARERIVWSGYQFPSSLPALTFTR